MVTVIDGGGAVQLGALGVGSFLRLKSFLQGLLANRKEPPVLSRKLAGPLGGPRGDRECRPGGVLDHAADRT
jgi:hypothetical protein